MINTNKHTLVFEVSQACQGGSCGESCECSLWNGREFKPRDPMPDILHEGCMCIYRPKTTLGIRKRRGSPLQNKIDKIKAELNNSDLCPTKRQVLYIELSELKTRLKQSYQDRASKMKRKNRKMWF